MQRTKRCAAAGGAAVGEWCVKTILSVLLVSLTAALAAGASNASLRYRGGLRNHGEGRRLNAEQLETVLAALRGKTGFTDLSCDENGFLRLTSEAFTGGSETARALLRAALGFHKALELENHDRSSHVLFARLSAATIVQNFTTGAQIEVQPIEIDIPDFRHLRGDKQALAAFDLGFALLHELGHAVWDLRDTGGDFANPGECEEVINRIRRELGLPERQGYVARLRPAPRINTPTIKMAELTFERPGGANREQFTLSWEAARVGFTQK